MIESQLGYAVIFGIGYFVTVVIATVGVDMLVEDAFWWPLHMAKALLKSLYRVLFTGWKA